jgi:hypothetical protein
MNTSLKLDTKLLSTTANCQEDEPHLMCMFHSSPDNFFFALLSQNATVLSQYQCSQLSQYQPSQMDTHLK